MASAAPNKDPGGTSENTIVFKIPLDSKENEGEPKLVEGDMSKKPTVVIILGMSSASGLIRVFTYPMKKTVIDNLRSKILYFLGMAGSGKTTFVQRLTSDLHAAKKPPYVVNLDPACLEVSFSVFI